jgi:hypothetical protein
MNKFDKRDRRASWMETFEGYVIEAMLEQSGKIEWDTAAFYFNSGHSPHGAALKYIAARKDNKEQS